MRSIHKSTLTIYLSVYVFIYSCVCIYAERYTDRKTYRWHLRNYVKNSKDVNKESTFPECICWGVLFDR